MRNKKSVFLLLILIIASLCLLMVSCGDDDTEGSTPTVAPTATPAPRVEDYTITVKTEGGMPLSNVDVYIYTDSTLEELVAFERTDENGMLTFSDAIDENAVAILKNTVKGYVVNDAYPIKDNETTITLSTKLLEGSIDGVTLGKGDIVYDLTLTDSDNKTHKISDILKEKKAVILNFWYIQCAPCSMEFPMIESAYKEYSDSVEVLAINIVDGTASDIAKYKEDNGLTFPMGRGDSAWKTLFNINSYPKTIVIDRYGMISMAFEGYELDDEVFKGIFAYYSSDSYVQKIVDKVDDIVTVEVEAGTEQNPYEFGGEMEYSIDVPAGGHIYCNFYKVSGMITTVTGESFELVYNGDTLKPENGAVTLQVFSSDTFTPVLLEFKNTSAAQKKYVVKFANEEGTTANPYDLILGEFSTSLPEGKDQGVYYSYVADKEGFFTIVCKTSTAGVSYDYVLYNLTSYVYKTLSSDGVVDSNTGLTTLTIPVKVGDTLQLTISALPDDGNKYPACDFVSLTSFVECDVDDDIIEVPDIVEYEIKITDEDGKAVKGVKISFKTSESTESLTTGSDGIATIECEEGEYTFRITVPDGYVADSKTYELDEDKTSITIKIKKVVIEKVDKEYTVALKDAAGKAITDASIKVMKGSSTVYTGNVNSNGVVKFTLEAGDYTVVPTVSGSNLLYNTGSSCTLSASKTSTTIVFAPKASTQTEELYVGNAVKLSIGSVFVELSDEMTYFVFEPVASGIYNISLTNTDASFHYMGASLHFIFDMTSSTDMSNNSFTLTVKENNLGAIYIIAAQGDKGGVIAINRIGAAPTDITDIDYIIYEPAKNPPKYTLPSGANLAYVDITGKTDDYKLVFNDNDGYYHIGTADGPVALVSLGENTPYISYAKMIETSPARAFFYDKDGNFVKKEDYTDCLMKYVESMDPTKEVYPLDADLMYIITNHMNQTGWCNPDEPMFLFVEKENVNLEIAWMFLICYIK